MKKFLLKKMIAVLLAMTMLGAAVPFTATAAPSTGVDYTIVNPYEDVDWENWGQYKANLHTHSLVSDGKEHFADMVERHYELGYDILAMTDHGTVDRSWTDLNINPGLTFAMNIKTFGSNPIPLTPERFEQISSGADRGGRGMLRVPYGIEHNAAAFNNTHVNSLFADWGDGYLGGTSYYDHILRGVEDAGGLSFINHPGEYTGARKDNTDDAYDTSNIRYDYIVKKFTTLFRNYESCVGMEIINKNDSRTKNDRKLWDLLLADVIPTGRNIFGFGNSDAHYLDAIDTNWNVMLMPSNTVENLRTCMEKGAFFAASHNIRNPKELKRLEDETGLTLGETWDADRTLPKPEVTNITVDNREDSIAITAVNHETIHWIADGQVIQIGGTIDLDNFTGKLGSYVRAEIWGEGGILYSQPFILEYEGAPTAETFFFFDFGWILHYFENLFYRLVEASVILSSLQSWALKD